ncbi:MAG TPA: penicillin acylase family protein [Thermomicrobiales bacterium]|nr:penicillin acylase family protein [Thermomicrobiales bacterium]
MTATAGTEQFTASLPDVTSTFSVVGLDGPIDIYRDQYGIPHVRATRSHDAFFGQGFAHAQDRLWQMEFDRRRAAGTLAECAGRAALDMDILMRRLQLSESARADYDAFDDASKAMFAAYTAGVNAFIDTTNALPVEFDLLGIDPQRWEPWHSGAIFKVRHVLMGLWSTKLWRARILNALGPEWVAKIGVRGNESGLLIVPPGTEYSSAVANMVELLPGVEALGETPDFGGSNNWAVHGSRTASGKPLVAGDPHRFIDVPNVYYQCHVACDEFDAIGFNFAGVPGFPHFAHTAHVAWCITHASADYQDLFVERFDPNDPSKYEFKGEWLKARRSKETIGVRGAEPVEVDVTITEHGPVVVGVPEDGHAIAMRYTSLEHPNLGLTCLLPMLAATSVEEMDDAMRAWVDPCNSMTMADVHGTIAYLHRGRVPVRSRANGWLPVPGWTGEHEWQEDVPFEDLPRSRNPDSGFISTANQRVVGDDYPHYLSLDYSPPHRGMRLVERLSTLEGATIEDMRSVHHDRVSLPSRTMVKAMASLSPTDAREADALKRVLAWDGLMDKHAVAPSIYIATRDQLTRSVANTTRGSSLRRIPYPADPAPIGVEGRLWAEVVQMVEDDDTSMLDEGQTWNGLLAQALSSAVALLRDQLGDNMDAWHWGRLHTTRPIHPLSGVFPEHASTLNPPSVSLGGDGDTPNASGTYPGQSFQINGTSVARYAFDLGDWDNSRWVVPLGASGHPGSPHFADQAQDWSEVRVNPMTYSWDKVVAEAHTTQRIEPA